MAKGRLKQDVNVILQAGRRIAIEDRPYEGYVGILTTVEIRVPVEWVEPEATGEPEPGMYGYEEDDYTC